MAMETAMERDNLQRVYKEEQKELEVDGDCGLETIGQKGHRFGKTYVAVTGEGEGRRIVYLDQDTGIWKCRHCSWTYKLLGQGMNLLQKHESNFHVVTTFKTGAQIQGDDYTQAMAMDDPFSPKGTKKVQISGVSASPTTSILQKGDAQFHVRNQIVVETNRDNKLEVLKSIVYGGLIESITSLCVVSSASGANTSTLNVVSMGLANLFGGLLLMLHHLSEIKSSAAANQNHEQDDRYRNLLGRRENFRLHATVSTISYIFFGLLPPVIYGFSSREKDTDIDTEYRLVVVSTVSLACIVLLAIGKAHINVPRTYIKSFVYYLGLGLTSSAISFIAGVVICRFLGRFFAFGHNAPV